jgi:hypothetical protein
MTWADQRLKVDQIKSHAFFYGADWDALRHIEPPFVPHLQSITDTSYFPTEDLGNVPNELEVAEKVGADKDLAFLLCALPVLRCLPLYETVYLQVHIQTLHGRTRRVEDCLVRICHGEPRSGS